MGETMSAVKPVIILTRPAAQNARFAQAIEASGLEARIIEAPVTRIIPEPQTADLKPAATAIFTSSYGVEYAPGGTGVAWCVGDRTAEVAATKGWQARSAGRDADALFKRICADLEGVGVQDTLVHYCGKETRGNLSERLSNVGISTQRSVVYRQEKQALSEDVHQVILGSNTAIFPVFSPNSAQRLVQQLPAGSKVDFVAISQATAETLPPEMVRNMAVAKTPDAQSLIEALRLMV